MRLGKEHGEGTASKAKGTACAVLRGSLALRGQGEKTGEGRREPGSLGDAAAVLRLHGVL